MHVGRYNIALATALASALLAGCVPLPQRVQDEFSAPDGERPNNFEIVGAGDRSDSEDRQEETMRHTSGN